MRKLKALLGKLRSDRGDLTVVIGVTLMTIIFATLLTMSTITAAALMKSSDTNSLIKNAIDDTKSLAFARLVTGQSSAVGVSSTLPGVQAYVSAQQVNPADSSVTITIIGRSTSDNVTSETTQITFTKFQANFFAGYDAQGIPFWIASPTTGTGASASPLYTGYVKGTR